MELKEAIEYYATKIVRCYCNEAVEGALLKSIKEDLRDFYNDVDSADGRPPLIMRSSVDDCLRLPTSSRGQRPDTYCPFG
uniref:Uncharacterized protein n=1 Tax=viral metagenome TaxID=1070528 RepID=A0A6M3LMI6_9ZZZZ